MCVFARVCGATLFNARAGWMRAEKHCLSLLDDWALSAPPPSNAKIKPQMVVSAVWWRSRMLQQGRPVGRGYFYFFTCFHPGSGICQLRTNGGISWGQKLAACQAALLSTTEAVEFRGHGQDSVCAHNNGEYKYTSSDALISPPLYSCHSESAIYTLVCLFTLLGPQWKLINSSVIVFCTI